MLGWWQVNEHIRIGIQLIEREFWIMVKCDPPWTSFNWIVPPLIHRNRVSQQDCNNTACVWTLSARHSAVRESLNVLPHIWTPDRNEKVFSIIWLGHAFGQRGPKDWVCCSFDPDISTNEGVYRGQRTEVTLFLFSQPSSAFSSLLLRHVRAFIKGLYTAQPTNPLQINNMGILHKCFSCRNLGPDTQTWS